MLCLASKVRRNTPGFDGLILSPPPGVVLNSKTKLLELKKKTTTLILEKLRACTPRAHHFIMLNVLLIGTLSGTTVTRMEYDRFSELVTARHHIVVKNWPLKKFCNPSNITSRIELELLHNAWQSGATYFQKLTGEEMEAWEVERFSSRLELMPPAVPVAALTPTQTPADMALFSEMSHQDRSDIAPVPPAEPVAVPTPFSEPSHQDYWDITPAPPHTPNVPLATITNLTPGPTSTIASDPLTPDPDIIARMIQADPALQNVDPALIAMGIAQKNKQQAAANATATTTTVATPPVERPSGQTLPADSSKRCWQEVVTPLSFDAHAVKKPRRQRKDRRSQNSRPAQDSENQPSQGVSIN